MMISPLPAFFLLTALFIVWIAPLTLAAPRNITLDDDAPEFNYVGRWERIAQATATGGFYHAAAEDSAYATIMLPKGRAFYYLSPRWHETVMTHLSFNNGTQDIEWIIVPGFPALSFEMNQEPSGVMFHYALRQDRETELRITQVDLNEVPQRRAIVDGIIITVDEEEDSPSSSETQDPEETTSAPPSQATGSPRKESRKGLPIAVAWAVGAIGGVTAVLSVLTAIWCLRRRRRQKKLMEKRLTFDPVTPPQPLPPANFSHTYASPQGQLSAVFTFNLPTVAQESASGSSLVIKHQPITSSTATSSLHVVNAEMPPPDYETAVQDGSTRAVVGAAPALGKGFRLAVFAKECRC